MATPTTHSNPGLAAYAKLLEHADEAVMWAKSAKRQAKSLAGSNYYARKFVGMKAEASNTLRTLPTHSEAERKQISTLFDVIFSTGAVEAGARTKALHDLEYQLKTVANDATAGPAITAAAKLRALLPGLPSADIKSFVEEAISCCERGNLRAAVVLSWVGAVAVIQQFVTANKLAEFNAEATRRDAKWRTAKISDDLSRMKEHDFLDVLEAISVIGKNVKQELQGCLTLRNGCGHPNSLKIGDHRVSAHIEVLVLNVYSKF